MYQVQEQASSVELAVLSQGRKIVLTTIRKPDFALFTSNARRVPLQYHVTPLQITFAQRSAALFVRNTLSMFLKKFMNASCKGPKVL